MSRIAPKAAMKVAAPASSIAKIENTDNQLHAIHQSDIHTKCLRILDKPAAELHPALAKAQAPAPAPQ
jgi:hypothetical protein